MTRTIGILQRPSQDDVLFGGLDEAGRGAVIGPLVLALAWFDRAGLERLESQSIRDSKLFGSSHRGRQTRSELAEKIRENAKGWLLAVATAAEVDEALEGSGLNELERSLAKKLLSQAPPGCRVMADGERIFGPLAQEFPSLQAENKADSKHVPVSAASILAKTERDRLVFEILARYEPTFGPIKGMGYPNQGTAAFLRRFHAARATLPTEVRRSWKWPVIAELDGRQGKLPF